MRNLDETLTRVLARHDELVVCDLCEGVLDLPSSERRWRKVPTANAM